MSGLFSSRNAFNGNGLTVIEGCMDKLKEFHAKMIQLYGEHNHLRLSGKHETSDINTFSYGAGNRGASIRIPTSVLKDKMGYFEDRRPGSNCDPYIVSSVLFSASCLDGFLIDESLAAYKNFLVKRASA